MTIDPLQTMNEPTDITPLWETSDPFVPYSDATWVYWTSLDTEDRGIPDEWVFERLRIRRDQMLSSSDFRVVADAPWDTAPWLSYRQALRDLPDTASDPATDCDPLSVVLPRTDSVSNSGFTRTGAPPAGPRGPRGPAGPRSPGSPFSPGSP